MAYQNFIEYHELLGLKANELLVIPSWGTSSRPSGANLEANLVGINTDITSHPILEWYDGTTWRQSGVGNEWLTTGNSGLTTSNFLGTTDNMPLKFKMNNTQAGYINDTGWDLYPYIPKHSVAIFGLRAGENLIPLIEAGNTGHGNTLIGGAAGMWIGATQDSSAYALSTENTYVGAWAGYATQHVDENSDGKGRNTGVGQSALFRNVSGSRNTAIGTFALEAMTKGRDNTALGESSLRSNIDGDFNVAVGGDSLLYNSTGIASITVTNGGTGYTTATVTISAPLGIGPGVCTTTATADAVIVDGSVVGINVTNPGCAYSVRGGTIWPGFSHPPVTVTITGDGTGATAVANLARGCNNVGVGVFAGYQHRMGQYNTFLGNNVGFNTRYFDTYLTLLGAYTDVSASVPLTTNLSKAVAIGYGASIAQSNTIVLGGTTIADKVKVGIGTNTPRTELDWTSTGTASGQTLLLGGDTHWWPYAGSGDKSWYKLWVNGGIQTNSISMADPTYGANWINMNEYWTGSSAIGIVIGNGSTTHPSTYSDLAFIHSAGDTHIDHRTGANWYFKNYGSDMILKTMVANKSIYLDSAKALVTSLATGGTAPTTTGTTKMVITDANGLLSFTNIPSGISGITADNGLTASTSTNVQLGGTLTAGTTIATGANTLTISTSTAVVTPLVINSSTGSGIQSISTGAIGIVGYSGTTYGISSTNNLSSTNTVVGTFHVQRRTTGTAADGIGASIDFSVDNTGGAGDLSNKLISKWTNATLATRTSQFIITGVNSGTTGDILTLNGNKSIKFNGYGANTFTGTLAKLAGFDASGNVIEVDLSVTYASGGYDLVVRNQTTGNIEKIGVLANYADDTAAAAGGIAVGQYYRNGSVVMVRVS